MRKAQSHADLAHRCLCIVRCPSPITQVLPTLSSLPLLCRFDLVQLLLGEHGLLPSLGHCRPSAQDPAHSSPEGSVTPVGRELSGQNPAGHGDRVPTHSRPPPCSGSSWCLSSQP